MAAKKKVTPKASKKTLKGSKKLGETKLMWGGGPGGTH
jgi:hypothetical protein